MYLKQRDDDSSLETTFKFSSTLLGSGIPGRLREMVRAHTLSGPKNSKLEGQSGAQRLLEAHQLLLNLENLHKGSSSAKAHGFLLLPRSSRSTYLEMKRGES